MTIRRALPDDAQAAAQLMIDARWEAVPSIPAAVHGDEETRKWFSEFVMSQQEVWLALNDAGQISAVLVTTDGWIEHLYVRPSETGNGIGSKLVQHAKSASDGELVLWTFVSNTGAQRFYERHGFVEIDRTAGDNEEGEPDIKYRWQS